MLYKDLSAAPLSSTRYVRLLRRHIIVYRSHLKTSFIIWMFLLKTFQASRSVHERAFTNSKDQITKLSTADCTRPCEPQDGDFWNKSPVQYDLWLQCLLGLVHYKSYLETAHDEKMVCRNFTLAPSTFRHCNHYWCKTKTSRESLI